MPDKPSFQSRIPPHLLEDASPKEKWLMESIDTLAQKSDYTLNTQDNHTKELRIIKEQVLTTNGRVSKSELDIKELKKHNEDEKEIDIEVKKIVKGKLFVQKYLLNKWTLVFILIFGIGLISIFTNATFAPFLKGLFKFI